MIRAGAAIPLAVGVALGWSPADAAFVRQAQPRTLAHALQLPAFAHRARASGTEDAVVGRALDRLRQEGISAADAAAILDAFVTAEPELRRARALPALVEHALDGPRDGIARRARLAMSAAGRPDPARPTPGTSDTGSPVEPPRQAPRGPDTLGRPVSDTARLRPPPA